MAIVACKWRRQRGGVALVRAAARGMQRTSGSITATISSQLPCPQRFQRIAPHYYPPLYPCPRHHFSLFTVPFISMTAMAPKRPKHFTHTPTFTVHDGIQIDVVHTNDLEVVAKNLDMYEKMLEGRQPEERFMGLDLE